jgi:hypothetical protein
MIDSLNRSMHSTSRRIDSSRIANLHARSLRYTDRLANSALFRRECPATARPDALRERQSRQPAGVQGVHLADTGRGSNARPITLQSRTLGKQRSPLEDH